MKIWILAYRPNFKSYANKRFREEAKQEGVELLMMDPEQFEIIEPISSESGYAFYKQKPVELPDCIICRTGSSTDYFTLAIIRHFERLGVLVINSSVSIERAKDKFRTVQILASKNIPVPKTMLTKDTIPLRVIKKQFHFPIVLKALSGSQGKGVVLCDSLEQLDDVFALTGKTGSQKGNFILQEFISSSRGKDIRVFVIGGRVIGGMLRKSKKGNFKANFSAGGTVENFPLTPELEWLAIESAQNLGLDMAGVDILFDNDSYRVCEVNSNPGFKGFEQATAINIPHELFQYIRLRRSGSQEGEGRLETRD